MRNETLFVGDPELVTTLQKSKFENCDITITCPARGLIINDCFFQNCVIRAKKEQANHQFFTSTFEGCKFIGEFPGCEFGFRIDLHGKKKGTVAHCGFREARLDVVSFNNCDVSTLQLPLWPHFTITNPPKTAALIPNPRQCEEIDILKNLCAGMATITKAVTWYAPSLADESRYSQDELREMLTPIAGILA